MGKGGVQSWGGEPTVARLVTDQSAGVSVPCAAARSESKQRSELRSAAVTRQRRKKKERKKRRRKVWGGRAWRSHLAAAAATADSVDLSFFCVLFFVCSSRLVSSFDLTRLGEHRREAEDSSSSGRGDGGRGKGKGKGEGEGRENGCGGVGGWGEIIGR